MTMDLKSKRFILVILALLAVALQNVLKLDPEAITKILALVGTYVAGESFRPSIPKATIKNEVKKK